MRGLTIEPLGQLVPGPAAAGVECLASNNNLDLVRFGGRIYLAWRTAAFHFATGTARIEVTSAPSLAGPWRHETTVAVGADVREPRFVVDDGANGEGPELHLFLMELGCDPKRFQPRRTWHVRRGGGAWTRSDLGLEPGFVPWRTRRLGGRWAMIGYRGGESMYGPWPDDPAAQIRWSDDLTTWEPPIDIHLGGIECELCELPVGDGSTGAVFGLTRNEGPVRFGGDLLLGDDVGSLSPFPIHRKLDSPYLFEWEGEPWVVARRSLAFDGRYDLAPSWVPGRLGIRLDQLAWWVTRKRSALYRLRPERLAGRSPGARGDDAVVWVADLPSRGDTSFAAVLHEDDDSLIVADYTTPTWVGDVPWVRGQLKPTVIQAVRVSR